MWTRYVFDSIYTLLTNDPNQWMAEWGPAIICLVILDPLWIAAGLQDYKEHSVSECICICMAIVYTAMGMLFVGMYTVLISLLFIHFVFRDKEIEKFGQADFFMVWHIFNAYSMKFPGIYMCLVHCLVWLGCLLVHIVLYRDENGRRYKPFKGMMIPAIPSFAAATVISSVIRVAVYLSLT